MTVRTRPGASRTLCATLLIAAIAMTASGCGKSPTSPSLSVAGAWTGVWEYRTAGAVVRDDVTATLTQTGTAANGSWSSQSGATGQLTFKAAAAIAGTLTISQTLFNGQVCTATAQFTGNGGSSSLELFINDIPPSGLCQWGTNMKFTLEK